MNSVLEKILLANDADRSVRFISDPKIEEYCKIIREALRVVDPERAGGAQICDIGGGCADLRAGIAIGLLDQCAELDPIEFAQGGWPVVARRAG